MLMPITTASTIHHFFLDLDVSLRWSILLAADGVATIEGRRGSALILIV